MRFMEGLLSRKHLTYSKSRVSGKRIDPGQDRPCVMLAPFHLLDVYAAQITVIVADVARASVSVAQLGFLPSILAVIAGSIEHSTLHADVLAGGHVGAGRNHLIDNASEDAVHVGYALGAAVGVFELNRHLAAIDAAADGVERGAFHLRVLAGFSVRAGRQ